MVMVFQPCPLAGVKGSAGNGIAFLIEKETIDEWLCPE